MKTLVLTLFLSLLSLFAIGQTEINFSASTKAIFYSQCKDTTRYRLFLNVRILNYQQYPEKKINIHAVAPSGDERNLTFDIVDSANGVGTFNGYLVFDVIEPVYDSISVTVSHLGSSVSEHQYVPIHTGPNSGCGTLKVTGFNDMNNDQQFNGSDTLITNFTFRLSNDADLIYFRPTDGVITMDLPFGVITKSSYFAEYIYVEPGKYYQLQQTSLDSLTAGNEYFLPFIVTEVTSASTIFYTETGLSMVSNSCQLPASFYLRASIYNQYVPSTPMVVTYNFGDGEKTTITYKAKDSDIGSYHQYTTTGVFKPSIEVAFPDTILHLTIQDIIVGSSCEVINGKVYRDRDSNCIFSTEDDLLNNIKVGLENPNGTRTYTFTDEKGNYGFPVFSSSEHKVFVPNSCNDTILTNSFPANNSDFALPCNTVTPDLVVSAEVWTLRPGFNSSYNVLAYNATCNDINADVIAEIPYGWEILNTKPQANTIVDNKILWTVNDFSNQENKLFEVRFRVPVSAQLGDTVCFESQVNPISGDLKPANNVHTACREIKGSYDPNDKTCFVNGQNESELVETNDELVYRIRFQNTGTDTAFNIFIVDTIHENLDLGSLELLNYSHPVNIRLNHLGIVRFEFNDILLPDDKTNEPESHGFVTYKIKPKESLVVGDEMNNTAYIYFDYNSAIITNTTHNIIGSLESINELNKPAFIIYPNPANKSINIKGDKRIDALEIIDSMGKLIHRSNHLQDGKIDLSEYSPGIYMLRLRSNGKIENHKLLINH